MSTRYVEVSGGTEWDVMPQFYRLDPDSYKEPIAAARAVLEAHPQFSAIVIRELPDTPNETFMTAGDTEDEDDEELGFVAAPDWAWCDTLVARKPDFFEVQWNFAHMIVSRTYANLEWENPTGPESLYVTIPEGETP